MQQRLQYGIGVLHNRLLRRGLDPALEPLPPTLSTSSSHNGGGGATQASTTAGSTVEGVGEGEEEEEVFDDREPAQLVFVVHGIGEKMWASEAIQVGLGLGGLVVWLGWVGWVGWSGGCRLWGFRSSSSSGSTGEDARLIGPHLPTPTHTHTPHPCT